MTMKGRPSSSPSSWIVQMCGWVSAEASRASRSNRDEPRRLPVIFPAQELDRHLAVETHVLAAIDDAHAALAELLEHAVVGDDCLRHGGRRSAALRLQNQEFTSFGGAEGTVRRLRFSGGLLCHSPSAICHAGCAFQHPALVPWNRDF